MVVARFHRGRAAVEAPRRSRCCRPNPACKRIGVTPEFAHGLPTSHVTGDRARHPGGWSPGSLQPAGRGRARRDMPSAGWPARIAGMSRTARQWVGAVALLALVAAMVYFAMQRDTGITVILVAVVLLAAVAGAILVSRKE